MANICGFLDTLPPGSESTVMDAMLSDSNRRDQPRINRLIEAGSGAGISTDDSGGRGATERIGAMLISYEGRPRWAGDTPPEIRDASSLTAGIARAYTLLGLECLNYLSGPFALAILIPEQRRALLAIDKMGIRPLAFGATATGLAYASNASSLAKYPGIDHSLSPQAIHDYLYFHMVPSPQTIFRGIRKLPPAHCALYDNGRINIQRYWSPHFEIATDSEDALYTRLRSRLEQAMDWQIDEDTSNVTGAFLSGGLDSSTVVGLLAERNAHASAYTIGFDAEGYDEIPYARQSAAHYRSRLQEYYVTPSDVADAIEIIAGGYDEPFGNASVIPSYFCAKMARDDGCTVLLAGDGGDEVFAGNERYLTQQTFSYFETAPDIVRQILKTALLSNNIGDSVAFVRKARSYVRQAAMPLPERLNSYNFLRRAPLTEIFDPDFLSQIDTTLADQEQRTIFQLPANADTLQRMLFLDWKFTLADNDLRKVNLACDLAGVEVRYPLLDDELVEFSSTIPSKLLIRDRSLRDFYKKALRDFLPPHTIGKKKHGFGLPFGVWMAQDPRLHEMAQHHLAAMKRRQILRPDYIDGLLSAQRSQHTAYYGVMIWVIVMLELWLQKKLH